MFVFKLRKNEKGFTLIEMMVSVSIFVIVAFIVTTVFITAMQGYRKAQNMKRIMENLNFALDTMSLDVREGTNIKVVGDSISGTNSSGDKFSYCLSGDTIKSCSSLSCNSTCPDLISSTEIKIEKMEIEKIEQIDPIVGKIPLYHFFVKGIAGANVKKNEQSGFSIQTTLSQRNR